MVVVVEEEVKVVVKIGEGVQGQPRAPQHVAEW